MFKDSAVLRATSLAHVNGECVQCILSLGTTWVIRRVRQRQISFLRNKIVSVRTFDIDIFIAITLLELN